MVIPATFGNAKFMAWPIVPVIPPSCTTVQIIMKNHHQTSQCAPKRGPGSSCSAPKVGRPDEMAYRPISICTKTLITQLKRINHRKMNPCRAPRLVVRISSPEPTIVPARMMPGPIFRRAAHMVAGGS